MDYPKFDLVKALAGEPCVLRGGQKYYVKCDVSQWSSTEFPLVGHLACIRVEWRHQKNGAFFCDGQISSKDIIGMWVEPHELADMPKDHPIWVSNNSRMEWYPRHFAGIIKQNSIYAYTDGKTSLTSSFSQGYDDYKLPTAEELVGTPWEGSRFVRKG